MGRYCVILCAGWVAGVVIALGGGFLALMYGGDSLVSL